MINSQQSLRMLSNCYMICDLGMSPSMHTTIKIGDERMTSNGE